MEKKNNMRAYIKRQGYYYNAILGAILRHFFILKIPPQVKRTRVRKAKTQGSHYFTPTSKEFKISCFHVQVTGTIKPGTERHARKIPKTSWR